jgi:hypothetical protein
VNETELIMQALAANTDHLVRIEQKVDCLDVKVAEMRGAQTERRRWQLVLTTIIAAVSGALTSRLTK